MPTGSWRPAFRFAIGRFTTTEDMGRAASEVVREFEIDRSTGTGGGFQRPRVQIPEAAFSHCISKQSTLMVLFSSSANRTKSVPAGFRNNDIRRPLESTSLTRSPSRSVSYSSMKSDFNGSLSQTNLAPIRESAPCPERETCWSRLQTWWPSGGKRVERDFSRL